MVAQATRREQQPDQFIQSTTSVRCGILPIAYGHIERFTVGSVIKKRRKRMAKKKHRKLLKRTRIQRRRAGK